MNHWDDDPEPDLFVTVTASAAIVLIAGIMLLDLALQVVG